MLDVIWNSDESSGDKRKLLGEEIARYQRAMLGSGHGYWEWYFDDSKMFWYGAFWREIGYDEVDIQKINAPAVLLDFIHPDDSPSLRQAVVKSLKQGVVLDCCYRLRIKSGDYLWVRVNGRAFRNSEGWAESLAGVNYDISQLKQVEQALRESESRYSRVIAGTRDGIWDWDIVTDQVEFSDVCWTQIGFSAEEARRNGWLSLSHWETRMHSRDVKRFRAMLREHILNKKTLDFEYEVRAKDGSTRWVRARAQATYNEAGKAVRVSGSNMDVTELKNTQIALLNAKVEAEKANQAKSDFLSSMSHELRTPLNAILGYLQLFDFETLEQEQASRLGEIRNAGKHLLHLINEVLDLASIEAGKLNLSMEPVVVKRALDDCSKIIRPLASRRGIELVFPVANDVVVLADNVRLKQALINLMSNAVKYNRPNGQVIVSLVKLANNSVRISVKDNGFGIPEAFKEQVFEPFNRLNASQSTIEGSGVGLVITRRLAEMMGGSIGFSSEEGVGSTFWLDLSRAATGKVPDPPSPKHAFAETKQSLLLTSKKRVLYIEDNAVNRRLFAKVIEQFGMLELVEAAEPLLGIFKARTEQPDIIVLDINLPELDGYEVLSVLQNDPLTQQIPVVALSANAMPLDIDKSMQAGFVDYLTKPLDVNCLIQVLNRCFNLKG